MKMVKRRNSRKAGFEKCPIPWKELSATHYSGVVDLNQLKASQCNYYRGQISSRFSQNCTSEFQENLKQMFLSLLVLIMNK